MQFLSDPHRLPWPFRLLALLVAAGLAVLLLEAGAAGAHLIKRFTQAAANIVKGPASPARTSGLAPAVDETPGVVGVQILPPEPVESAR